MAESILEFPARPPSEVEWEDVLLRVELMTRAVRGALADVNAARAESELREMVAREERVRDWLEQRSGLVAPAAGTENAAGTGLAPDLDGRADLMERFVSLRSRNFAMVQRRGLGVWEWSGGFGDADAVVTAYQLFGWLVRQDIRSLENLRQASAQAC